MTPTEAQKLINDLLSSFRVETEKLNWISQATATVEIVVADGGNYRRYSAEQFDIPNRISALLTAAINAQQKKVNILNTRVEKLTNAIQADEDQ